MLTADCILSARVASGGGGVVAADFGTCVPPAGVAWALGGRNKWKSNNVIHKYIFILHIRQGAGQKGGLSA